MELIENLKKADPKAIARILTIVENESEEAKEFIEKISPFVGKSYVIGFTGPLGSGKSTLIEGVSLKLAERGYTIGILAIDPSSPFSGGAFLGDRIRMQKINLRDEIFIRSISTRGIQGGLSPTIGNMIRVMDAAGKDFVIIETVGTGQDEVDVAKMVDTCIIVTMPGLGDEIQVIKAGLIEIGDIFVVNKADQLGADMMVSYFRSVLEGSPNRNGWIPPVVETVAVKEQGIDRLVDILLSHKEFLEKKGLLSLKRRQRLQLEILNIIKSKLIFLIEQQLLSSKDFEAYLDKAISRKQNPYQCAEKLLSLLIKMLLQEEDNEGKKD